MHTYNDQHSLCAVVGFDFSRAEIIVGSGVSPVLVVRHASHPSPLRLIFERDHEMARRDARAVS
jgi:hypothetical protein